ncbi:MAG: helix-turn-helix domain-containing protein [Anaerolineae bacterium]|nr:helix-turn-helix domain-containing protein [Anaerolineae bacterium]
MPRQLKLRPLSDEELVAIKALASAEVESDVVARRAKVIAAMYVDPHLTASEAGLRAGFRSPQMGPIWVRRFNAEGIAGLGDRERPGRAPVHGPEIRRALITLALQKPEDLGYPYDSWPLKGLQRALLDLEGVYLSDSTIWTWLDEEGLCWRQQSLWPEMDL